MRVVFCLRCPAIGCKIAVFITESESRRYHRHASSVGEELMRAKFAVASIALVVSSGVLLAAPLGRLAPKDIQTTFFNGKPFTASTTSNVKFKMVFTPEGTMT